jgi:hypothetical protein
MLTLEECEDNLPHVRPASTRSLWPINRATDSVVNLDVYTVAALDQRQHAVQALETTLIPA